MNDELLTEILESAEFIVSGYAFQALVDGNVRIVNLSAPYHAAVIDSDGNILETNMHDIELDIVLNKYWVKNKKHLTA